MHTYTIVALLTLVGCTHTVEIVQITTTQDSGIQPVQTTPAPVDAGIDAGAPEVRPAVVDPVTPRSDSTEQPDSGPAPDAGNPQPPHASVTFTCTSFGTPPEVYTVTCEDGRPTFETGVEWVGWGLERTDGCEKLPRNGDGCRVWLGHGLYTLGVVYYTTASN